MTAHAERSAMSEEEYRAYPVPSFSALKCFISSTPAHFHHKIKATVAMEKGTAKHAALLEPHVFQSNYQVNPWKDFRKEEAKENRDSMALQGVKVLSQKEYDEIAESAGKAWENPAASKLLTDTDREVKMFFEVDGVKLKGMADAMKVVDDGFCKTLYVIDVKTTRDASDKACARRYNDWYYQMPMQLATYALGAKAMFPDVDRVSAWVIFIEDKTNFVNVMEASPESLEYGENVLRIALSRYKECKKTGVFPSYNSNTEANALELDQWMKERYDNLLMENK